MYVLVHHVIHDPARFWSLVGSTPIPEDMKLHHSIPARDGSFASCLWEADSVDAVRDFVDAGLGDTSTNHCAEAENREGLAMPSNLPA